MGIAGVCSKADSPAALLTLASMLSEATAQALKYSRLFDSPIAAITVEGRDLETMLYTLGWQIMNTVEKA
jgi:hypothetical protein